MGGLSLKPLAMNSARRLAISVALRDRAPSFPPVFLPLVSPRSDLTRRQNRRAGLTIQIEAECRLRVGVPHRLLGVLCLFSSSLFIIIIF